MTTLAVSYEEDEFKLLCYMKDCNVMETHSLYWGTFCLSMNPVKVNLCSQHKPKFRNILQYISNTNKSVNMCFNLNGACYFNTMDINNISSEDRELLIVMLQRICRGMCEMKSLIKPSILDKDTSFSQIEFDHHTVETNIKALLEVDD